MAPTATRSKADAGQSPKDGTEAQVHEMEDLKEQLRRISTENSSMQRENDLLRQQVRQLLEKAKQSQQGVGKSNDDVNKRDAAINTSGLAADATPNVNTVIRLEHQNNAGLNENIMSTSRDFGNLNSDLVTGILSHFESLQVNAILPIYDGERGNPGEFFENLEKYFIRRQTRLEQKIIVLEDALKGRAKRWYEARANPGCGYEQVKAALLEEFFSLEARIKAEMEWTTRKFSTADKSLQEYFIEQKRNAKFVAPRSEESEINFKIIRQLPSRARDILATIDFSNTEKIIQALSRLDISFSESRQERPTSNYNNSRTNTNNLRQITRNVNYNGWARRPTNTNMRENNTNWRDRNNGSQRNLYIENETHNRVTQQGNVNYRREFQEHVRDPGNRRENRRVNERQDFPPERNLLIEESAREFTPDERQSNVRTLRTETTIDPHGDLCWDVLPSQNNEIEVATSRVICPRIKAIIKKQRVSALIDSGSDITCIAESLYTELKLAGELLELPVTNLSVYVAIGKKNVTIKRQVQLELEIGKIKSVHPFLVIPGLSTSVIIGSDWMDKNRVIIDYENCKIKLLGEYLPDEFTVFRSVDMIQQLQACKQISVNQLLWYKGPVRKNLVENVNIRAIVCDMVDEGNENLINGSSRESVTAQKKCVGSQALGDARRVGLESELREYVSNIKTLDLEQKKIMYNLLWTHRNVFSSEPGRACIYEHVIRLSVQKPYVRKSYPVPLHQRDAVKIEINKMLSLGIIERSSSSFCNPLRIVGKKNGEVRLCLDARYLNRVIEGDNECPPVIEEILQKYEGVRYISTTDFVAGYLQIPLAKSSRPLTAFLHDGTLYQYTVVPFGVKDSGCAFIKALKMALGIELEDFVTAYVDDLLIASRSFDEHVEHLTRLFKKLIRAGMTLSLKKSLFFRKEVPFLGFILSSTGVRADPEKLRVIEEFPAPRNKKQLQAFLGVCGYYRRFSIRHANFVEPFRELLSGDTPWIWDDRHDRAFQALKDNFLRSVVLPITLYRGNVFAYRLMPPI